METAENETLQQIETKQSTILRTVETTDNATVRKMCSKKKGTSQEMDTEERKLELEEQSGFYFILLILICSVLHNIFSH